MKLLLVAGWTGAVFLVLVVALDGVVASRGVAAATGTRRQAAHARWRRHDPLLPHELSKGGRPRRTAPSSVDTPGGDPTHIAGTGPGEHLPGDDGAPPVPEPAPGPDPTALTDLVVEFLRQSAIFPAAVLAREDWLPGQESVASYRTILYRIFLEANQPQPPMGVKQWSSRMTPEQRDVLLALTLPPRLRQVRELAAT